MMRYETQEFPGQISSGRDPINGDEWETGMTLLDYFAATAMQSFCNGQICTPGTIAQDSYDIAQRMMEERAKRMSK